MHVRVGFDIFKSPLHILNLTICKLSNLPMLKHVTYLGVLSVPSIYGAFVRPDLSNECAIPNILKALRFRLHFHCIFLFPCISKQAFNKCPFSTHEMCSSCHLTNHFFPQPFFGSSFK